jgi:hypothetical protein
MALLLWTLRILALPILMTIDQAHCSKWIGFLTQAASSDRNRCDH